MGQIGAGGAGDDALSGGAGNDSLSGGSGQAVTQIQAGASSDITLDNVGNAIEVRWTKYVTGQLIIHEYDRPNDIAVLVTGQAPHYFIAGWIPIAIAQRAKYRHSKQPNWWVTQINLQPIENLRKSNYGQSAI